MRAPEADPLNYTNVRANRVANDAYWTEPACTQALLRTLATTNAAAGVRGVPPLPHRIWEPSAGANWIAAELEAAGYDVAATDIADYAGTVGYRALRNRAPRRADFLAPPRASIEPFGGMSHAIVGNPPFDDDLAEAFVRVALGKPHASVVWFLLKNEFDTSNEKRPDLFDRPDYAMKIVLRWRPLWSTPAGPILNARGKAAGARQHYAWFGWFKHARPQWPGARILYADKDARQSELPENRPKAGSPFGRLPKTPPVKHWQDREG